MSERTFDDFDEYAEDYREIHSDNIKTFGADSFYFANMKVGLLREFEKNIPLQILDIGCGDGATELFMLEYFPQWLISGIDVSKKSIAVARERKLPNASFAVYNGTQTSFAGNSFDIIFMAGVLHHVNFDLHQSLIKETYRVLKPGGRLYVFEHNPLNPVTKYLVKTCVFDKYAKLVGSRYASTLFRRNNFRVDKKRFIVFFPRKGILSRLVFLEKYLHWIPMGGHYFLRIIKQ